MRRWAKGRTLRGLVLPILFLALTLPACDSGSDPDDGDEELLSSLWPNADGDSWTFRYRSGPVSGGDDPGIEKSLAAPSAAAWADSGTLELAFDGTVMTADGPKQNLTGVVAPAGKHAAEVGDPILARIWIARPDLRARMIDLGIAPTGSGKDLDFSTLGPLFPGGGAFEKQESWIGYYPDAELGADSSYTVLKAPLADGASFRQRLVPALADDIWEYGWIGTWSDVETGAGTFHALDVFYFLDLGEADIIDEEGHIIGTFAAHSTARAWFAPGVGPIRQRGTDFLSPPVPDLGIEAGIFSHRLDLVVFDVE